MRESEEIKIRNYHLCRILDQKYSRIGYDFLMMPDAAAIIYELQFDTLPQIPIGAIGKVTALLGFES